MKIYQLKTPQEFLDSIQGQGLSVEAAMYSYAEHVATSFAAECVNKALGNKMEVSNALHSEIEKKYNSIIWDGYNNEEADYHEEHNDDQ